MLAGDGELFLQSFDLALMLAGGGGVAFANGLDLHQGYISLGSQGDGLFGRFGRQEVNFGGQRLVGAVGWTQQLLVKYKGLDWLWF